MEFEDGHLDADILDLKRSRKQLPGESFDDFHHAILNISDLLRWPMGDHDLLCVLQSGFRSEIRKHFCVLKQNSITE